MSEYPQHGMHPDPDSLSAFVEGVLPEHERLACLAHMAACDACREVVFLAQEPLPVPVADRVVWWKRWLAPIPALSVAAVAGILVVSVAIYRVERPVPKPTAAVVAKSAPLAAANARAGGDTGSIRSERLSFCGLAIGGLRGCYRSGWRRDSSCPAEPSAPSRFHPSTRIGSGNSADNRGHPNR